MSSGNKNHGLFCRYQLYLGTGICVSFEIGRWLYFLNLCMPHAVGDQLSLITDN